MTTSRDQDVQTAKKKGLYAGAAVAASVSIGVVLSPVIAVVGLVPAAYLVYDWFQYRAKRGMRF